MKNETATNQQESKMKHTPTPWSMSWGKKRCRIEGGADGWEIASVTDNNPRDAAYIVEACNNYERVKAERDELLAALRKVVDAPNHAFATGDALFDAVEYARRAIAKAEAK